MTTEVGDVFEVVLGDDAMAPEFPAGVVIRFDRRKTPRVGGRVLIRDAAGNFHFRMYAQAVGDPWRGVATNAGYLDLLPGRDGATIFAVKDAHYVQGD